MGVQSSPTITLQALRARIGNDKSLPKAKRTELASAINTFAKVCGRSAADILADPAVIRGLAAKAPWKIAGLSKRGWANVKSRLTQAMELAGVAVHRQRRNYKLAPKWDELLAPLIRRDRDEIRRFAGWCSARDVAPAHVSPETFEAFLAYLEEQMVQTNPRERAHVARRAWNRAVALPGSGYLRIPDPAPRTASTVQWEEVPASLREEAEAFRHRMESPDVFDESHQPLKPVTLTNYLTRLRVYITALVESGVPIDTLTSLARLVEPSLVKRGLQQRLGDRSPDDEKARKDLQSLAIPLLSIAKYLGVDVEQRTQLKQILKRVQFRPNGLCPKNKERLAPFADRHNVNLLLALPTTVAEELSKVRAPSVREAQRMQMACLLEILLHVPLRAKNVAGLRIGQTIMPPVAGKTGRWRISIEMKDVKNRTPIDAELGEETGAMLDRYMKLFRPVLMKLPTDALFVSQRGEGKGPSALAKQYTRFIKRETGLTVNAHLMRHLAAKLYLKARPGDYESVRRMLGHKNIQTTVASYAGTETEDAFARYDQLIASIRGGQTPELEDAL